MAKHLTAIEVSHKKQPGMYAAGDGLYLQVSSATVRSWIFRFQLNGRRREMGLGSFPLVSLAEARERTRVARQDLKEGRDPIEAKKAALAQAKLDAAQAMTFRTCAQAYIDAHKAGWRNEKHVAQWTATLKAYAYPVFGEVPIQGVDLGMVMKVLEPIWRTKPETATRVRGRVEAVLDWARARGYRTADNPARWRGLLDQLLPARAKVRQAKHHAALPFDEIGAFVAKLRKQSGVAARGLEFLILTATRTSEVTGAEREEVKGGVWTIPAGRIKAGKEHRVPLPARAVEILEEMANLAGDYLFPGGRRGQPLSENAFRALLKRMGRSDLTAHGFRSTFRDWAAERTSYPHEVAEMALAHAIPSGVERAYRRGDLFEKRTRMMADWAKFCDLPKPASGDVVPIQQKRPSNRQ
jgi:integrase